MTGVVAVVTGGAGRLGMAVARRLAPHPVVLVDRHPGQLDRAVQRLRADGVPVEGELADVTDDQAVRACCVRWVERGLVPAVLVNAAGVAGKPDGTRTRLEQVSDADWQQTIDVNLTGAFRWCRAVAPAMRAAGHGRIVNVASLAGRTASPTASLAYSAAKAGLIGLTRALAVELAADGVLVNAVAPSRIVNPDWPGAPSGDADPSVPLGRLATPEEVAEVIAFLAGPANTYVTGATVDVNGGRFTN